MTDKENSANLFVRELTLADAARVLQRRRWIFGVVVALFLAGGAVAAFSVGTPLSVACAIKTAYLPPGAGPESIDEVNERILAVVRAQGAREKMFKDLGLLDVSLWQQTVSFMRIGESRTLQISGRAYSEEGAKRLAEATATALVEENNAAVSEAMRIGELRLSELKRLSAAAARMTRSRAFAAEGLNDFAGSISGWSAAEAQKAARELENLGKAELKGPPAVTKAATWFNRAMIVSLFAFLGAVTALVGVLWTEAWRHGAKKLFF